MQSFFFFQNTRAPCQFVKQWRCKNKLHMINIDLDAVLTQGCCCASVKSCDFYFILFIGFILTHIHETKTKSLLSYLYL